MSILEWMKRLKNGKNKPDPKFEVGEIVVATKNSKLGRSFYSKGDTGTIRKRWLDSKEEWLYTIDEFACSVKADKIDYPKVRDTEIARTLYKNKIRRIENGWIYISKK